jgi:hypothetical protein
VTEISNDLYREAQHERRLGVKVDPERLATALNREARRVVARRLKAAGITPTTRKGIIYPAPRRTPGEAMDDLAARMAAQGLFDGTVETLSRFLTTYEEKVLREAHARGKPLPREVIRAALLEIYRRGMAQRGGK